MEETGTSRLEAFSDGVFAIAATLLILEIGVGSVPGSDLRHALVELWPAYLAYATSFLTIGIIWMNHHYCVETMGRVDRTLLFVNLLLLLTVAFLPFPTSLVANYLQKPGEQAAVYVYDGTFVVMSIIYNFWWRYASHNRRLIADGVPEAQRASDLAGVRPRHSDVRVRPAGGDRQPARQRAADVPGRRVLPAVGGDLLAVELLGVASCAQTQPLLY